MKKLVYILFAMIVLAACDFEVSDNGDLDGFWQLRQLDTLATGAVADMRPSGITWGVQHKLLEIRKNDDIYQCILFRFEKGESTLRIYRPVINLNDVDKSLPDSLVTDVKTLEPLGIQQLDETLQIEQFSADEMVLRNDKLRFHLRKY